MHKFKSTKKFVSLVLAVMMVLSCVAVGVSAASTVKVAFTNNKGWNQVGVYAWDTNGNALLGDWPGTRLTNPTQNDFGEDVYVAEIPSNASNIIFNDNTANGAQTADIDFDGQSKGYYPNTQDGSGHWVCGTWAWTPDDQGQGQGQQGTTVQGTTATVDTTNTKTVYFTNNKGWSDVKAYAWNAQDAALLGEWPGTSATKAYTNDFGEDVYKVTLPAAAVGVVFNGNGGQSNDKQTADITPANNTGYYPTQQNGEGKWEVGSWPVVDNDETTVPGTTVPGPSVTTPVGTKTVYFTNNKGWSDVKAYAWNAQDAALLGEWPGTSATKAYTNDFGEDVYKVTLPAAAVGVVFNGNGGQSNDKQTADITPANNTGYYPTQQNGEGKWEVGSWPVVVETTAQTTTVEESSVQTTTVEETTVQETTVEETTAPGPIELPTDVPAEAIYVANFKPNSYSISLKDSIAINFRVNAATVLGYTNPYLVVTMNGQETVINDYETLSDGTLVFAFDKVYPQTVIDDATAVLHGFKGDQEYYGDNYTRSVLQYCVNNQTKVGNPNSLKGLLVNLLQYAGEAQKYMHYKENTLASDPANINSTAKRYAKQTLTSEDLTSVKNFNAEPLAGTPTSEFTAATLVLGNTVGIKVTFKATDLTNKAIRVDFNGATTYFSGEDLVQGSEGKATFTYPLYATQFNDTVKFTVCDGTTPISDTMTYSVASYAGKYIEPLNETFGPLLKSMMLYGKQAKTYATEAAA